MVHQSFTDSLWAEMLIEIECHCRLLLNRYRGRIISGRIKVDCASEDWLIQYKDYCKVFASTAPARISVSV